MDKNRGDKRKLRFSHEKFKKFENDLFCIGGGIKNATNLRNLTSICQKITKNKNRIFTQYFN